ncbi:MAG TPA: SDR family oxidoreductase, partial [Chloroflexota bacterium]|nr:SDR family oxidoreductase [Chloroflexota bacterium]
STPRTPACGGTVRLQDKVVMITGAASGIGFATAQECADEGAKLVLADLPAAPGLRELSPLGGTDRPPLVVPTDVTRLADCQALAEAAEAHWGRIDALINCAGILQGAFLSVDDLDEETFQRVVDVNLAGSFRMAKAVVPSMRRAGRGTIVLIASGAGVRGGSSSVAYGSSKGAVHGLAMVLEPQLAPAGIRVNDVCPGSLNTPLKRQNVEDGARAHGQSPEEALAKANLADPRGVARVLAFLASDDAAFVRGSIFTR